MLKCFCIIGGLLYLNNSIWAANILGIFTLPGKSHSVFYHRILTALAEKGHHVDVFTTYPMENPSIRYNQIELPIFTLYKNENFVEELLKEHEFSMVYHYLENCGYNLCNTNLNSSIFQNLKNTNKTYDLLITQILGNDCPLGFGNFFQIPIVSLLSSMMVPWGNDRIGNPDNPSYIANAFMERTEQSLYGRIKNTLFLVATKLLYQSYDYKTEKIMRNFFGQNMPDLDVLRKNTSLILVNTHYSFHGALPTVPNLVEVGGAHIQKEKPLPKNLEKLLHIGKEYKGVIYFTMSTLLPQKSIPKNIVQEISDALAELPYLVLWRAEKSKFSGDFRFPSNVHFEKWLPQKDILCHPNVKLFIYQGGMLGTQEAIHCAVPCVGIPLYSDQDNNVSNLAMKKSCIGINKQNITKISILEAATEVLNNPKYKQNMEKISKLWKDRPMPPLQTAVYWIEYVIRNRGAPELRSLGADLPWYQYHLVDVAAILLLFIIIILYFFILAFKLLGYLCHPHTKKPKKE